MDRKRLVIKDNSTLREQYDALQAGDVFVGRLCLKPSEESVLLEGAVQDYPEVIFGISD